MNIEIIKEYFTLKVDEQNYQIEFERHDHSAPWKMRIVNPDENVILYTRELGAEVIVNAELAQGIVEAYVVAVSE